MDAGPRDSHELRDSYGRGMNTLSERDYKLPADRTEMERLSLQHRMWKLLVGGLYPLTLQATVEKALGGPQPTILDAGCPRDGGPFPNAHVVGVDLSRNFQERTSTNFEFIQMDLTKGLPVCTRQPAGYDLIHARSLHSHPAPNGSWFAGWQDLWLNSIIGSSRVGVDALLERNPLSPIFSRKYLCPVGWDGDGMEKGAELGDITLKNALQFTRARLPATLAHGKFSLEELKLWVDESEHELQTENFYLAWDLGAAMKLLRY
ncbi:hypothetical protein K438DRAFT_1817976, partial [Mycena galopus ATCC 62051]